MKPTSQLSPWLSTGIVVLLAAFWAYVRLWVFRETALPLTYVLPLLVCVWSRRVWQLWSMTAFFLICAATEAFVVAKAFPLEGSRHLFFGATVFNLGLGFVVVRALMVLRDRLDASHARLAAQNRELESQAAELAQQNEELKAQGEELAQQSEEIEAQSEELAGQNQELHQVNDRLTRREAVLQGLLEAVRTPAGGADALRGVCDRALAVIGAPAEIVAILNVQGETLAVESCAGTNARARLAEHWPVAGSIASVVLACDKTAYVSDLEKQPELAAPFSPSAEVRSVLATPVRVAGRSHGILVACSRAPAHWTTEQFQTIEWLAAQSGLIAEALRWQSELTRRAAEIEAANHAKDQFLAMLSHELRTPLTPVLAAASVLEHETRIPEDVRQDLRMIRRNVAIQSRLVDDLLDLTRLSRGKLALQLQVLDMAPLLHEAALIVTPDLDAKGQQLTLDLFAAEGRLIQGDGPRLEQVFWNLLKNASKFSPPRTRITLQTRLVDGSAPQMAIDVVDMGIGIEPVDLPRLFRPFEQVAVSGRRRSGDTGLGLGLSIAKGIVDLHGGSIVASSEGAGRGSRFTVHLPLLAPATSASPRPPDGIAVEEAPLLPRELHILLVEDHADTGRILARLLKRAGHAVEHCATATAALEAFGQKRFDLLISDLGLPDQSGLELMKQLRALRPDLPGICLSGYGMEDDLQACREVGFAEHLTKPVDMKRLHQAIDRISAQLAATR